MESRLDIIKSQGLILGTKLESREELIRDEQYSILDQGVNKWVGGYTLLPQVDSSYEFKSVDLDIITYTEEEMDELISAGEIAECLQIININ